MPRLVFPSSPGVVGIGGSGQGSKKGEGRGLWKEEEGRGSGRRLVYSGLNHNR